MFSKFKKYLNCQTKWVVVINAYLNLSFEVVKVFCKLISGKLIFKSTSIFYASESFMSHT